MRQSSAVSLTVTKPSCQSRAPPAAPPVSAAQPSVRAAPQRGPLEKLRLEPIALRPAHVRYPAEPLEDPDKARVHVDLAAQHAVPGAGRIGVVQVVPVLAE